MCRHWRVHGEYFALNSMFSSFETLSKFPLSKIMSTSFKTPFAGSALYWCFAGILWSKHNVHKQVQLIKHFCVSKPKASIAMSKNPKQKSQPFLLLKRWLVLVPLQPRIHRFPRRGVKFCLLCYFDAKLPIANFFPLKLFKQVGCHDLDECSYYSNSASYCGSNNEGCINIGKNDLIIHKTKHQIAKY